MCIYQVTFLMLEEGDRRTKFTFTFYHLKLILDNWVANSFVFLLPSSFRGPCGFCSNEIFMEFQKNFIETNFLETWSGFASLKNMKEDFGFNNKYCYKWEKSKHLIL